jgi:hypothetical protein
VIEPARRPTTAFLEPILVLLAAVWLAGCTQPVKVTSAWKDDGHRGQAYKRVLVVGVSPNIDQRCAFEQILAAGIRSASTVVITSCDAMPLREKLTRESVEAAVAAKQIDAVVATSLIDQKWELETGGTMDTRGGGMYKATDTGWATGYYGAYGVPVVYGQFETAASITTLKGEVQVTTKVYETRGPTLVYEALTTAKNLESTDQGLVTLADAIAGRLRRDGLAR